MSTFIGDIDADHPYVVICSVAANGMGKQARRWFTTQEEATEYASSQFTRNSSPADRLVVLKAVAIVEPITEVPVRVTPL